MGLLGCQQSTPPTVPPATGAQLAEFSHAITKKADRTRDAGLYEYFCRNSFATACPPNLGQQLHMLGSGGTRVDVADAFVRRMVEREHASAIAAVSDDEYVEAAYQVVFGRKPDEKGRSDNIAFLRAQNERKAMLRQLLQSDEFRSH